MKIKNNRAFSLLEVFFVILLFSAFLLISYDGFNRLKTYIEIQHIKNNVAQLFWAFDRQTDYLFRLKIETIPGTSRASIQCSPSAEAREFRCVPTIMKFRNEGRAYSPNNCYLADCYSKKIFFDQNYLPPNFGYDTKDVVENYDIDVSAFNVVGDNAVLSGIVKIRYIANVSVKLKTNDADRNLFLAKKLGGSYDKSKNVIIFQKSYFNSNISDNNDNLWISLANLQEPLRYIDIVVNKGIILKPNAWSKKEVQIGFYTIVNRAHLATVILASESKMKDKGKELFIGYPSDQLSLRYMNCRNKTGDSVTDHFFAFDDADDRLIRKIEFYLGDDPQTPGQKQVRVKINGADYTAQNIVSFVNTYCFQPAS